MITHQTVLIETTDNSGIVLKYRKKGYHKYSTYHLSFTDEKEAMQKMIGIFQFDLEGLRKKVKKT